MFFEYDKKAIGKSHFNHKEHEGDSQSTQSYSFVFVSFV